jgi:hypothetical protein
MTWVRVAFCVLALSAIVGARGTATAHAAEPVTVAVKAPLAPAAAGTDAMFVIRVEGASPAATELEFSVTGGTLSGAVALNDVAPGVAEGAAYVRRDTPGEATLTVLTDGRPVGSSVARFDPAGLVELHIRFDADASAAARTWRFEIVNAAGKTVSSLSAGTSGDGPLAVARSEPLPYGFYSVSQVLSLDTQTGCAAGAFFEIVAPAGGTIGVRVDGPETNVDFVIRPCAGASRDHGVTGPVDSPAVPIGSSEGISAASPGMPQPPSTGLVASRTTSSSTSQVPPAVLAAIALVAFGTLLALAGAKVRARPPS